LPEQTDRPTVFVVDDDASMRSSLTRLLRSADLAVETYASAREFLDSDAWDRRPGCLVLDVRMPGLDGLALQEELLSRDEALPIIFITGHGDIPMAVDTMKKGAIEFLPKPFDDEQLLQAVRDGLQKDAQARAVFAERTGILKRLESLTPREYEVLTYILTGMLNKQIAGALAITEKTVIVHRGRVLRKMGVTSVAELVQLAAKAGVRAAKATP
jgi:FixJ family two-component response regulator